MYNEGVKKTTFNQGNKMFSVIKGSEIMTFKVDGDSVAVSRAGSNAYFDKSIPVDMARWVYAQLLRQGYAPL